MLVSDGNHVEPYPSRPDSAVGGPPPVQAAADISTQIVVDRLPWIGGRYELAVRCYPQIEISDAQDQEHLTPVAAVHFENDWIVMGGQRVELSDENRSVIFGALGAPGACVEKCRVERGRPERSAATRRFWSGRRR